MKKGEPPAASHDVDEADSVDVARGPFAAHIDKSGISVEQVLTSNFLSIHVDSVWT